MPWQTARKSSMAGSSLDDSRLGWQSYQTRQHMSLALSTAYDCDECMHTRIVPRDRVPRDRDRLKAGVEAGAVDGILAAAGRGELLLILGEVPVRATAVARAGVVAAVLLPLAGLGDLGDGLFDFGALVVTGVRFFSFYT
jgi:hypothetical protein